jgi:hypothetical protein
MDFPWVLTVKRQKLTMQQAKKLTRKLLRQQALAQMS